MIVTIMQPAYLPWLGYFDRIASSDLLIFLDHVQIENGSSFTNRNRIRSATGSQWLTVPIRNSGSAPRAIDRVQIVNDRPWRKKHWTSIRSNYAKARHFDTYAEELSDYFDGEQSLLVDTLLDGYHLLAGMLGLATTTLRSSRMGATSSKGDLILDLCRSVSASRYISGPFGRDYLDREAFERAGIDLVFHDYDHPTYEQVYPGFEPYMSVIDVLLNHGPQALKIVRGQVYEAAER